MGNNLVFENTLEKPKIWVGHNDGIHIALTNLPNSPKWEITLDTKDILYSEDVYDMIRIVSEHTGLYPVFRHPEGEYIQTEKCC